MARLTSRPTSRRILVLILGAALAAAAAIAFATVGGEGDKPDPKAVEAWQKQLFPLVEEWGKIEVQGMRPAIGDLTRGDGVPPEAVGGEARAWRAAFVDLRAKIAALDPPPELEAAERLFDQSMQQYLDSTFAFEQAADGPVDQRQANIEKGINLAKEGARLYNEASLILQRVRKEAGLGETRDFPNHPAGEEIVS